MNVEKAKTCDHFLGLNNEGYGEWRLRYENEVQETQKILKHNLNDVYLDIKFIYCPFCGEYINNKSRSMK